jgi:hypothetical protein
LCSRLENGGNNKKLGNWVNRNNSDKGETAVKHNRSRFKRPGNEIGMNSSVRQNNESDFRSLIVCQSNYNHRNSINYISKLENAVVGHLSFQGKKCKFILIKRPTLKITLNAKFRKIAGIFQ